MNYSQLWIHEMKDYQDLAFSLHFLIEVVLANLNVGDNSIKDQVILAPQIVQHLYSTKSSGKDESVG